MGLFRTDGAHGNSVQYILSSHPPPLFHLNLPSPSPIFASAIFFTTSPSPTMADFLDNGEFWLPPRFLNEDDALIDNRSFSIKPSGALETPSLYGSNRGSPVESLFGSTENESEEEDMLADLSRSMARSTLDDGFQNSCDKFEERMFSRSPQSTLYPTNLDLLCQTVGEVANRRLSEELYGRKQHCSISVPLKPLNSDAPCLAQNSVWYHQLLEYQIQQLKQQKQQMILKQQQRHRSDLDPRLNSGKRYELRSTSNTPPLTISHVAWPALHQATRNQQNGSVLTAVSLGVPAAKREYGGTGVFFPRRAEPQPEQQKKPAALLPGKVVNSLNFENVGPPSTHLPNRNGVDIAWKSRRNGNKAYPVRTQPAPTSPVMKLPQEWTY